MNYVCVHAHFYQPPRGNPWEDDRVPRQGGAAPFHDWNERITAECYTPFSAATVLAPEGGIARVENLYARVSFNVGPTLLAWLEQHATQTYAAILEGDRRGRGAIAQAFNHTILPLMSSHDKHLQLRWGLEDFERRFGRRSEGMWLPECAVDFETLEALADENVRFTILSPASAANPLLDTTRPYLVPLPSGREMCVFFYNGALSRAVAFERLLDDGARFAQALVQAAVGDHEAPLAHIATDGESYGHHHRFGEMALAFALGHLGGAKLTTYSAYLDAHPPQLRMELRENTSWSCEHGIERWRSDCGCNTGRHAGANQAWRGPLRDAIDWLARALGSVREMQRAYTSCAWFFDDPSDIETLQVLAYAGRAIELYAPALREPFMQRLRAVKSITAKDGAELFLEVVGQQSLQSRIADWRADPASDVTNEALAEAVERTTDREALRHVLRIASENALGTPRLRHALGFSGSSR